MERWLNDGERALRAMIQNSANEISEMGVSPSYARPEWNNLLGEIAAYRAFITGYYLGNGPATLAFCQDALAHLSAQNFVARASVAYARSLAYHSFGDIVAAIQSTREATALAKEAGDISPTHSYLRKPETSIHSHGIHNSVV